MFGADTPYGRCTLPENKTLSVFLLNQAKMYAGPRHMSM